MFSWFHLLSLALMVLMTVAVCKIWGTKHDPKTDRVVVGVFAVLLIIFLYWTLQSVLSLRRTQQKRRAEEYNNIIKSEKASYLLLKKYFEQILYEN